MNILLTGGAGFIGSNLIKHVLANHPRATITILDRLDHSGTLDRLSSFRGRVRTIYHDLRSELNEHVLKRIGHVDIILHLAAMSHVDRSISDPLNCVMENVVGTCNILEAARRLGCKRFLYFSTDEVFGPAPVGHAYKEWERYNSGNPYSASKAGGEELALAYHNTFRIPVVITHTMNVFGPMQSPEKFIPNTISKILNGEEVLIHADKTCTIPGSRFYIHASDVARAILFVLDMGKTGEKYNIVGKEEVDNLRLASMIAEILGEPLKYRLVDFHSSRPGHDLRYALDGTKLAEMGWVPSLDVRKALEQTIDWYVDNPIWLN